MIEPTQDDIGRRVIYDVPGQQATAGTITHVGNHYVFVIFEIWDRKTKKWNPGVLASATDPAELSFVNA
jgi:hypothetical protein